MKRFLKSLIKALAYSAAGLVIALAIAVGLFRLFLPRLPEYQDQIKGWASDAIGMQVEFSRMNARWGLRGPELEFYDAELIRVSNQTRAVAAQEVSVGVALMRLLVDRKLVVDRVTVRETAIEVRQLEDGRWWVQGTPSDDLLKIHTSGTSGMGEIEVVGEDIEIRFLQPGDERPRFFDLRRFYVHRDSSRITVDAAVRLPDAVGRSLSLSAIQLLAEDEAARSWDVSVSADGVNLAEITRLAGADVRGFSSGVGDTDVSLVVSDRSVESATADVEFRDVSIGDGSAFEIDGRIEFKAHDDGWLVATEELVLVTEDGAWPESQLRLETEHNEEGEIVMVNARASYVKLADLALFSPWLPEQRAAEWRSLNVDGEVRGLQATALDLHRDVPRFDVSAELDDVGFAAFGKWPGVRGLSGSLQGNSSTGHVDIFSEDMTIVSSQVFPEPLAIEGVEGRLTWFVGNAGMRIVSDSIRVRSGVMSSENNVHITIDDDASAPFVDMVSTFTVPDLALAKQYIPMNLLKPKLYSWFQNALESGSIPRGSARFYGPVDKFPFDDGEGQFLVQGNVRNASFRYNPKWPAADLIDVDVIVDNARLYTERGRSASTGNQVIDANVEIADLRNPVLTIDAFATGTLETVRQFVLQSPLHNLFGGQLERVDVDGEAAFDLDLMIPIRAAKEFEVETRIRTNSGRMQVAGFPAAVTDLSGVVTITRDDIVSESLGGTFLGQPVDIGLRSAREDEPDIAAVASANGTVTATALVEELGLPLASTISGESEYQLHVRFPKGGQETPMPLTFIISSDLVGFGVDLPPPFGKSQSAARPMAGDIRLSRGGELLESAGSIDDEIAWELSVTNGEEGWDFDRGVLALGGASIEDAETRGLHIRGRTQEVRFRDWLELSRSGDTQLGTVDRIRSIDVAVGDLFILGQHLVDHRLRIDRSARDWLVQLEGDNVSGSVFVPYDFDGDRALVVDMQRLQLPGDQVSAETDPAMPDPRGLPPISLRATEFILGDRNFGAVKTDLRRTAEGLETDSIIATDATFEIVGNGRWVIDETDPAGQRTFITATLTSNDVQTTMQRLNYDPGIAGDDMSILLDLNWSGGPRADFLGTLNGKVEARFGSGQLEEVEPGAGRVFGLMSIIALPRRLSLDFRDVFDEGFGFDKIVGTFRIEDGQAYTCNLSLQGPAADIGIIGRAGLNDRDYEQTAVVSANLGNTLPLVGAVVAGPQAAAAMFLFSQIFKKPLQEVGQVYYRIEGSWDDPLIESTNAEGFARVGELSGCLADSE